MATRVHYIDRLRVLAVLLLIPFHSARIFDVFDPFYAKSAQTSVALSVLIAAIDMWHMPLLFLLAGASSYFALAKRDGWTYVGERSKRLLVPLVFGTLVIVPPQAWFAAMTNESYKGSLLAFWPSFYQLRGDLTGYQGTITPAHLWFVLFLFLVSLAALPLMKLWRGKPDSGWAGRAAARLGRPLWWLAPVPVIYLAEGLPDVGGKNFFYYLVFFLLGFIVMADARFIESVERHRAWALGIAIVGIAVSVYLGRAADGLLDPSFPRAAYMLFKLASAWIAVLACLGYGKARLDRPSPLLTYSAEASYPFYILHQTVIVAFGFYLLKLGLGVWPTYALVMLSSLAGTLALYEVVVRRTNVTRFLFGMRPLPKASAARTAEEAA